MRADVDQRTAALCVFVEENAPGGNRSAADGGSLGVVDIAEGAVLNLLLQIERIGTVTALIADRELLAAALCRVKHLLCFERVDGHRLFAHNVLACLKCGNGDLRVPAVRGQNVYDVDGGIVEQNPIVGGDHRIGGAVFCLCFFCTLEDNVAKRDESDVLQLVQRGEMLSVCNAAASDDAYADDIVLCCFHVRIPFILHERWYAYLRRFGGRAVFLHIIIPVL